MASYTLRDPAFHRGVMPAVTTFARSCNVRIRFAHTDSRTAELSRFYRGVVGCFRHSLTLTFRRRDQSRVPSLQRVVLRVFPGTTDPSDSLPTPRDFSRPALSARSLPDKAAGEGLSCSAFALSQCATA